TTPGGEVLLLFLAVIWRHGTPEGGITAAAINGISPAQLARAWHPRVEMQIESLNLGGDTHVRAYDVWYLDEEVLCRQESAMPPGTPLQALNAMSHRSQGRIPQVTQHGNFSWADLAKKTRTPDLQAQVAAACYAYPDTLQWDGATLAIAYPM